MTLSTVAVLRPGDWVHCDGSEHQVLALAGTSVRLRTVDGADSVVLAGHLMASPGFAVVDSEPAPSVEPFALLDSLPGAREPSGTVVQPRIPVASAPLRGRVENRPQR